MNSSQKMTPMNGPTTVPTFGMNGNETAMKNANAGTKTGYGATTVEGKRHNCGNMMLPGVKMGY